MRPVAHTLVESVHVPMAQVFAFLTSPGRMPDWLPQCTGLEYEAPLKRGAKFTAHFGERVSEFEVVDYAPPATFGWAERGERTSTKTFFRLDGVGGSTALTIREVWMPRSFLSWLRGRVREKRHVERRLSGVVEYLRSIESVCRAPVRGL
ncbi:MAG TPA: SRPBCC family protein [Gemmatimonadales bacterium]|nr:SRPBCC family protein [Gemmatimonadales bacterium]